MKTLAFTAVLALSATPALASDWRIGGVSKEFIAFIDVARVKREGSNVEFWNDVRYSQPLESGTTRSMNRIRGDCEDRSFRYLFNIYFVGEKVTGTSEQPSQLIYAPPGTVIDATIDAACTGNYRTGTIADLDSTTARLLDKVRSQ